MAGNVPEPVRRARAAQLLGHAAERRAAFAADQVGTVTRVLFEQRTADGAWLGHGDRHVLVEAGPDDARVLDNVVAHVALTGSGTAPDRVRGRLLRRITSPAHPVEAAHAQ
jgi:hypothetical protein